MVGQILGQLRFITYDKRKVLKGCVVPGCGKMLKSKASNGRPMVAQALGMSTMPMTKEEGGRKEERK